MKFTIVAVDYFTKSTEAEAIASITTQNVTRFLWKSIVTRFGILHAFVTDNGKQFDCQPFRDWCEKLRIRNFYSFPGHPQANGQVEITNKTLFTIIKKKLEERKGAWADELHEALWAYRTTPQTPTGDALYGLAFGNEAIIPVEIITISTCVQYYNPAENDEGLRLSLNLIEERREKASLTMATYQQKVSQYFNKRVRPHRFVVGDWVLHKITTAVRDSTKGKLALKWEGPYKVVGNHRPGAYHLEDTQGKHLPHPWNAQHMGKFYQ